MTTYPRIAALEELYEESDEDCASDNPSDTDDAEDEQGETLYASETDTADADRNSGKDDSSAHAQTMHTPPHKRSRWTLSVPELPEHTGERRLSQVLHEPATKGNAINAATPDGAWSVLFSNEILEIVVKYTNEEINRKVDAFKEKGNKIDSGTHKNTDIIELKALLGLLYYAGVHKMSKCKIMNWWSIHCMPLFRATMPRNRFVFLSDCLRFDNKNTRAEFKAIDRFTHIREVWDLFIENCKNNYEPGLNITIDEQFLSYRGRCIFKMNVSSNSDKYGLNIVTMNDAVTHYMINAIPYCGTVTGRLDNEPIPTYYARKLSEPIHDTGRNIICDNWFSSYSLFEIMKREYNLSLMGTTQNIKREIQDEFESAPKSTANQYSYTGSETLLCSNKKKTVLVLSTNASKDNFNKKCLQYTVARQTVRWPLRIFYGMLDQANVNSFILYHLNKTNSSMNRMQYIIELSMQLVKPLLVRRSATPTLHVSLRHMIGDFLSPRDMPKQIYNNKQVLLSNKMPKQKRCSLCPWSLDRKTHHKCLRCEKPMCKDHTAKMCCECAQ